MELPGRQAELIEKVSAANRRTIVVLNAGSPLRLEDWIGGVPAVLQAWYGGQEFGNALAELLFGDESPSGRLPTTFPKRIEDNPAYLNYPGEGGQVHYGEGIFVGYRYYDTKKIEPQFPFGHGLSYTAFDYGELRLERTEVIGDATVGASIEIRNVGERVSQEVVQLYARDLESKVARPMKELVAFAKIELAPGQSETIRFELCARDLAFWDPGQSNWVAEPGEFELLVGASSRDIRGRALLRLNAG
jgi:beta-glucosidase